jgi:hypothetical protein
MSTGAADKGKQAGLAAIFSKKLAAAGYSPAHAEYYQRPLRILAEELYDVKSGRFLCRVSE